eukprot:GFUD01010866.1.p1 GENE.GFUD01010866.1~~GFUD01010866.1.p1  ORF type:complete len:199 (-),score=38.27 GFUD01010866.1:83-637(-)
MVLTKDVWLPTEAELTVQEVPLGTPSLRAGAMHLGKYCEVKNNDFMLCRSETQDPRKCLREGAEVTSCSLEFFKKVKASCSAEFMSYAACLEKSSASMDFLECRKTQAMYDACVLKHLELERPHYGYHCLPKIHETDRPQPVEEKPDWMNNDKARKLGELPKDFPRTYKSWGSPGVHNPNFGDI